MEKRRQDEELSQLSPEERQKRLETELEALKHEETKKAHYSKLGAVYSQPNSLQSSPSRRSLGESSRSQKSESFRSIPFQRNNSSSSSSKGLDGNNTNIPVPTDVTTFNRNVSEFSRPSDASFASGAGPESDSPDQAWSDSPSRASGGMGMSFLVKQFFGLTSSSK